MKRAGEETSKRSAFKMSKFLSGF